MTGNRNPVRVFRPADARTALNARRRARELAALADRPGAPPLDVLVVGGGVTGCGVALDAASRGLSVALVEKHDLAFGTSRWSSKLVHGGLRYLAHGDVAVAAESARERGVLMGRTAPHLLRPMAQVVPYGSAGTGWPVDRRAAALVEVGAWAGNGLRAYAGTSSLTLRRPSRLSAEDVVAVVPTVRRDGLAGGIMFWDGQLEDDARLVVALARTAAGYGAHILTRVSAVGIGEHGALLRDEMGGGTFDVAARTIVNATGVWAGTLDSGVHLRPSKGVHVVLPASVAGSSAAALTAPVPGSHSRYVFALPQPDGDLVYLGITDDPIEGPVPDVPEASDADVSFLLRTLSSVLERELTTDDVVGTYAGLRPLLAGDDAGADGSADISRRHAVLSRPGGLITLTGGKLTTYRQMAQDVVDLISDVPCRTRDIGLVGAGPVAAAGGVPPRLVRRFGAEAAAVAAVDRAREHEPVVDGLPELRCELEWAVRFEGALTVEDLVDRRTRLGLRNAPAWAAHVGEARVVAGDVLERATDSSAPFG